MFPHPTPPDSREAFTRRMLRIFDGLSLLGIAALILGIATQHFHPSTRSPFDGLTFGGGYGLFFGIVGRIAIMRARQRNYARPQPTAARNFGIALAITAAIVVCALAFLVGSV